MNNRQKIALACGLLLFALLKVAAVHWWQQGQNAHIVQVQAACNVTDGGCPFLDGATLHLIGVGNAKTPFTIEARHVPPHVRSISASFQMNNMEMGFNRFELQKVDETTWRVSSVYLPLCVEGRNDWQIHWQADGRSFSAGFQTLP